MSAMFFDSESGNAFGAYETRTEAIRAAIKFRVDWSPFVLMIYGPDGAIIECLSDEDVAKLDEGPGAA